MRWHLIGASLLMAGAAWAQQSGQPLVPGVEFDQTPLEDALEFLAVKSREPGSAPVSFVLIEPESIATRDAAPAFGEAADFTETPATAPADAEPETPAVASVASRPVTLSLTNVPLGQVVRYVCDLANVSHVADGGGFHLVGEPADLKAVLDTRALRRRASPGGEAMLRRLAGAPVQSVEFRGATLGEVAELIHGLPTGNPDELPINILVREGSERPVNLQIENTSALHLVNYAADQTRLGYRADPFALVIGVPERLAAASPAANLPASLRSQIVPEVDLDDVPLSTVVDLVRAGGNVNVLMEGGVGERRVSLHLRRVPLSEVLRYAAELTGCTLGHDGLAIRLGAK